MYDLVKYFEMDSRNILAPVENIWGVDKPYYTVADQTILDFLSQNQTPFFSKITSEENFELPESFKKKLMEVTGDLKMKKEIKGDIEKLLTKLVLANPYKDLEISKSNEGEFLV